MELPLRILVRDDQEKLHQIWTIVLSEYGYQVGQGVEAQMLGFLALSGGLEEVTRISVYEESSISDHETV